MAVLMAAASYVSVAATARADETSATLYYSRTDGAIGAIDIVSLDESLAVPSNAFVGAVVGASREIAFDPESGLLWYSATDGTIYSLNVNGLADGPMISGIPGANSGADRHLFIDYAHRTLLVPITDGSVEIYSLATQQSVGSIPSNLFTDGNVGGFRHFASDPRTGNVWFAATDGSFRELDPVAKSVTGRQIPFSEQTGANPGAFRHFVVDPTRDQLFYMVTDDSVASIDVGTLEAASFTIPSATFAGALVGAGRIITYDAPQLCGQPRSSRTLPLVSDCLVILQVSVGARICAPCVCDTNGSGGTSVSDALLCVRGAVGQVVELDCPACS